MITFPKSCKYDSTIWSITVITMYNRLSSISQFVWNVARNPQTDGFWLFIPEKSFVDLFCYVSPVPVFENHGYFRITSFASKLDFQNKNVRLRYVKFLARSIPIDEIYIYQFVPQNLYFSVYVQFPASPYFIPLLWVQIWFLREIVHGM